MGDEIYTRHQAERAQKIYDELYEIEDKLQEILSLIQTKENIDTYFDEINDLCVRVSKDRDEAEKEKDRLQDLVYELDSWENDKQERNREYREMQGF